MGPRRVEAARRRLTLALCALAVGNLASTEEAGRASADAGPEVRTVVAGKEFDRGGKWRFWFGEGYRKAWATPVQLPMLDLETEKGGRRCARCRPSGTRSTASR
jgi:hypothetical protein